MLGMSHDGNRGGSGGSGDDDSDADINECQLEAEEGSVMAPMVGATFTYFHWLVY